VIDLFDCTVVQFHHAVKIKKRIVMNQIWPPVDHVFWELKQQKHNQCTQDISVDVAIVGGGFAGLHAAQECIGRGKKVALLEQAFCGAGASGKSSGFITPNAELYFSDFAKRFNDDVAQQIWQLISEGVSCIESNIQKNNFNCQYQANDTFILANNKRDLKILQKEQEKLTKFAYHTTLLDQEQSQNFVASTRYAGGMLYPNTFSVNPFLYCQELKEFLIKQGILIFEDSPVTQIQDHVLHTPQAKITAENIIVCVDKDFPTLNLLSDDVYHAQTFVMVSQELSEQQIRKIFPQRNLLAWDMQLIYNYFRISQDQRLVLGGGDIFSTYASHEKHNYERIHKKLTEYFDRYFPGLNIVFEYQWPGLIGISKDIAPMIGRDEKFKHIFYVTAATGLPIAAALGAYSIQHLFDGRNDMQDYFSPYRKFPVSGFLQKIIGKKLSFMLSNVIKQNVP
jgi:gamma-glutamylputrescine oxidase